MTRCPFPLIVDGTLRPCVRDGGHDGDCSGMVPDTLIEVGDPCTVCGAYWKCGHDPDPDPFGALREWVRNGEPQYIAPDSEKLGDTPAGKHYAAQLQGDLLYGNAYTVVPHITINDPDRVRQLFASLDDFTIAPFRAWYSSDGLTWRKITNRAADMSRALERCGKAAAELQHVFAEIATTVRDALGVLMDDPKFALACAVYLWERSRKWCRATNARGSHTLSFAITPRIRGPPQLGAHFLTSASSVTTGGGRSCHRRPSKEGTMPDISFAWTTPALLARAKTCTRRDWANERYARQFREGVQCTATDRQRRYGGKPIALIKLTADAVLESTRDAPESDYAAEGFEFLTKIGASVDKLAPEKLWRIWKLSPRDMYVVRFEVVRFLVPHLHWCPECASQNPHDDPACVDGTERGCGAGNHTRRLL